MGGGKQLLFIECLPVLALCQVLGNMVLWEEKEKRQEAMVLPSPASNYVASGK